jgi:hypothetical protein
MNLPKTNIISMDKEYDALICFVDVVDSTALGKHIPTKEFFYKIVEFQKCFKRYKDVFFKKKYAKYADTKGEEGLLILADNRYDLDIYSDLFEKVVGFLVILQNDLSSLFLRIGAGIHFGKIGSNSEHDILVGWALNVTKRIETASREGLATNIFVSDSAKKLSFKMPIVYDIHRLPLKGISNNISLNEIIHYFINFPDDLTLKSTNQREQSIDEFLKYMPEHLMPSFLQMAYNSNPEPIKKKYWKCFEDIIWQNINEHNPIIMYLRGEFEETKKKYDRAFYYYKKALELESSFFFAIKKMISLCQNIAMHENDITTLVSLRVLAEEFLFHFPNRLEQDEVKSFENAIDIINTYIKGIVYGKQNDK